MKTVRSSRVAIVVAVASVIGFAAPVAAATVPYPTAPLDSYNVKGTAYATLIVGDRVYVGGSFTQVKHNGISYGYQNLAAFDVTTGALVLTFAPNPDKEVRALASDGTSLFVGGKFISIGGAWRNRLASVDLATGVASTSFNADVGSRVDAVATDGSRVFFGGQFTSVDGTTRNRVAAVDVTTGDLDAWDPNANNNVTSIHLSPDATTAYVGGTFGTIAGTSRSKLVALSTTTVAAVGTDFSGANSNVKSLDVSIDGTVLYAGDTGNDLEAYDVGTGAQLWQNEDAHGDIQAVKVAGDNVYMGFHDGADAMTDARLAAVDAASGATESDWNPTFQSTYGVFGIDATDEQLVIGGEFWQISGVAQDGVAIFAI